MLRDTCITPRAKAKSEKAMLPLISVRMGNGAPWATPQVGICLRLVFYPDWTTKAKSINEHRQKATASGFAATCARGYYIL